ncbi:MAG: NADH-quinone oxidoreductase subunit M [Bacteroidota bacterium]|nr:NADH-quinone oxidoreductase subunit M [Bacteroidota bacterium]
MLTLILILIPFLTGLAVLFIKNPAVVKRVTIATSFAGLLVTFFVLAAYANKTDILEFNAAWIPAFGVGFHIGIDGLSMLMVLLTNLLSPFIYLSGLNKEQPRTHVLYALMLFMQAAMLGVFTAVDGFLFYVFWELSLIPIYFIVLLWGGKRRQVITLKFFIYTLLGSLLMLVGLIYLYFKTPNGTWELSDFIRLNLPAGTQGILFWFFFLAFAIKMPIFPLHTWQPETYTTAPSQGTMMLSAIMLKMGVFGVLRWLLPVLPLGVTQWGTTAMILAITGIIYASFIALKQDDLKTFVAYSSIAHVGLMGAGIFSGTLIALQGAAFQMLVHGINVVALFYIIDLIERRLKTREISRLGGIKNKAPLFSAVFMIVMLGMIALPLTNGFVGEFLLITGIIHQGIWFGVFAALTMVMGAIYMLYAYQKVMLGEANTLTATFTDIKGVELAVLLPLAALVILLGVYPQPILDLTSGVMGQLFKLPL